MDALAPIDQNRGKAVPSADQGAYDGTVGIGVTPRRMIQGRKYE